MKRAIQIRPATLQDLQEIAEIKIDCQQDDFVHQYFIRQFKKRWQQRLKEGLRTLILFEDEMLKGLVSYAAFAWGDGRMAEISHLYISPEQRRRGLGSMLCLAALEKIKSENFQSVAAWVHECSDSSMRFYNNLGFKPTNHCRQHIIHEEESLKEVMFQIDLKIT